MRNKLGLTLSLGVNDSNVGALVEIVVLVYRGSRQLIWTHETLDYVALLLLWHSVMGLVVIVKCRMLKVNHRESFLY